MYDVTNKESFDHIPNWVQEVDRWAMQSSKILIVGNKADLVDQRVVEEKDVEQLEETRGGMKIPHLEISTKTSSNIEEAFSNMARLIMEGMKAYEDDPREEKKKCIIS